MTNFTSNRIQVWVMGGALFILLGLVSFFGAKYDSRIEEALSGMNRFTESQNTMNTQVAKLLENHTVNIQYNSRAIDEHSQLIKDLQNLSQAQQRIAQQNQRYLELKPRE